MTDDNRDEVLFAIFANSKRELTENGFADEVLAQTDKIKRRLIIRRVLIGIVLALITVPLEDSVLALSQFLLTSLVEFDGNLVADFLAPVNSVGGLLSIVLLAMRIFHRRLFS